ncbi:hypothetical protein GDO78_017894 [Eleutherodactylus coqui]|uniref:G-protein coupled receptors family 1 profile domain-containing protein n=1 Tax=Eleutherodactylus coqui TaxID=57060 RepID=A0A8J6ECN6_ELECQ|nr:hypothetical protein GDO78_017894 [Eleutherodactylus coqui]
MKNETSENLFYIVPLSEKTKDKPLISIFFCLMYFTGVLVNSSIITAICLEVQLHKPMYLFICNLSIVDIFLTTVTVPKLLHILLSGNHIVSFSQCYTQLYFFMVVGNAEEMILFIMAYDRYVAICIPLHYPQILSRKNCTLITFGIWAAAFLNSLLLVVSTLNMTSCHSNIIHQTFCDFKSLTRIICTGTTIFFVITGIEILILSLVPVLGTCISYVNIFKIIFKMKSKESRRKAFSTCSSHVTVMSIFYGACLAGYLIPPYIDFLDVIFNVVYTNIIPMINPIIYSLQNSNVQSALLSFIKEMFFLKRNIQSKW